MSDFKTRLEEEIKEVEDLATKTLVRVNKLTDYVKSIEKRNNIPDHLNVRSFGLLATQIGAMYGVLDSLEAYSGILRTRLKEINEQ